MNDKDHSVYLASHARFMQNRAVNEAEWEAASIILNRAAEIVKRDGFQQGAIEPDQRVCAATALEQAFRDTGYSIVDFNYAKEALSQELKVESEPTKEVGDPLAVPYWGRSLMEWNDTPRRTGDDLYKAFRAASERAKALQVQAVALKKEK